MSVAISGRSSNFAALAWAYTASRRIISSSSASFLARESGTPICQIRSFNFRWKDSWPIASPCTVAMTWESSGPMPNATFDSLRQEAVKQRPQTNVKTARDNFAFMADLVPLRAARRSEFRQKLRGTAPVRFVRVGPSTRKRMHPRRGRHDGLRANHVGSGPEFAHREQAP